MTFKFLVFCSATSPRARCQHYLQQITTTPVSISTVEASQVVLFTSTLFVAGGVTARQGFGKAALPAAACRLINDERCSGASANCIYNTAQLDR
ncbi:uncharacterized protein C8Q71DRAFT_765497 [Rhodofomes roseus]|uniref:Uncharacterized protein n=1 Tax=Rhodofomes roseus TaxID=34475 RepID=A0ABQ8KCR8_9APHY|nr:uncharacterized protein C8Q71DRAFT_765497 [Rhodofomes roseus]KAH9835361.1 hypothetical protein C8Q71DRAFT_765497 [Rhodofomes roseus]